MASLKPTPLPHSSTSHPQDPIPEEPARTRRLSPFTSLIPSSPSLTRESSPSSNDATTPNTPITMSDESDAETGSQQQPARKRRASTMLVSQNSDDVRRFLGLTVTTEMIKNCCGGGCCMQEIKSRPFDGQDAVVKPDNASYKSLNIRMVDRLGLMTELADFPDLPTKTVSFESSSSPSNSVRGFSVHPPKFVTPHPPYEVFSAPLHSARELTKPGAEKRTFHFDLDVTDYPEESGDVDFVVGGAIGVCAPNPPQLVDQVLDLLGVPRFLRDKSVLMRTTEGRWPTIWGEEQPRESVTTRRELLTWCSDLQSYAPTKPLLRILAEYAEDPSEKKILTYLTSAQGQAAFCDLRTGPYVTLLQLLAAFPSSRPPLDHLLSVLSQLMPRFYSLSQDPQNSCSKDGSNSRRIIEIAVTVHEMDNDDGTKRTGVGSGFLERLARQMIDAERNGLDPRSLNLRVPMFRGLMANPLAREFVSDGPMMLIGAGVGIAPFRGFVHRRLKSANCANKVWVLQGIRDSLVDELYSGDWGVEEGQVKKVVQSRRGQGKYVQEEVRNQADLVWFIVNAVDGRIFVCGSSKGMGEGVEDALVDVAMEKGNLNREEARMFWEGKKNDGQYITETW